MVYDTKTVAQAWSLLDEATVRYQGANVGTIAALATGTDAANYDQIFTRDFFVSGLAFLLAGKYEIVKNFLRVTSDLQQTENSKNCFQAPRGLMPASFKVIKKNNKESLVADFGEKAIGRVTPVDSSLWWLLLMRMYIKASGDKAIAAEDKTCSSIKRILDHYLIGHFELIPTLLVPDGAFMIDRRMGMYGHPLDIEVLFDAALRSSREILGIDASEDDKKYIERIDDRIGHLTDHIRADYWIDPIRLNSIYRCETEQFGDKIANKYNIYVSSIPSWVYQWVPENSGYFLGNIGPGRMDFRFLTVGNLLAVLTSLAEKSQQEKILRLLEVNWEVLVGSMPIKLCYPALEGKAWHLLTGADGKNTSWSYHNGGNWPTLLWLLIAAAMKMNNKAMAIKAIETAAKRLSADDWPEYYDGQFGNLIGKEARKKQVWTAAGFIVAHSILKNPDKIKLLTFDD
ncbi:MAG: glycoside hydrolase 100 family protein [Desulfobacteraceae bacterium]|jgi:hypothetical protein|nr:glycoside hydrolase 100 family protein [Desulfobacteraceae bacterium]